jgi:hypothetical protein
MLLSAENTTIFATELNLIYKNESSGFFTGMFIYHGELYKPGLYILAIIGVIVPICFVYMMLRKRAWTERILDYNERMQRQLY